MGNNWSLRLHYNKLAFQEIFGTADDPGAYVKFKSNALRNITAYTGGITTSRNPAAPCRADFCCDVDNVLSSVIKSRELLEKFFRHYIMGNNELNAEQQTYLEQKIGQELRKRKLIPVNKYFRVVRRKYGLRR
jgi:hypothetical protein